MKNNRHEPESPRALDKTVAHNGIAALDRFVHHQVVRRFSPQPQSKPKHTHNTPTMKQTVTTIATLAILALVACNRLATAQSASEKPSAPAATSEPARSQQKPRQLTKEDKLICSFSQDLTANANNGLSGNVSATTNHFTRKDKDGKEIEIELTSPDSSKNAGIENGMAAIRTKNFGTVYRGNEEGKFDTYYMTEDQIKKLKKFLGL